MTPMIMQSLRSRELQKIADKTSAILDEANVATQDTTIEDVCAGIPDEFPDKIRIGDTVVRDLDLDGWFCGAAHMRGGSAVMRHILHNPISDIDSINVRANVVSNVTDADIHAIKELAKSESTVLWALALPSNINDAWPLNMLFPSWPIIRYINYIPWALLMLHIFRGYISPVLNVAYPLSGIFAPYFYLRRYMRLNITLYQYINCLRVALAMILRPTNSLKQNVTKYVTAVAYVVLFLYGLIQGFDMAYLVRKMRADIFVKMKKLSNFVATAAPLVSIRSDVVRAFSHMSASLNNIQSVNADMSSFYALVTNASVRKGLKDLLRKVYVLDAVCGINQITKGWSKSVFVESETKMWAMGHPLLEQLQVRNPISLEKNLIITGPNAGGKTTYMKSLCANMLLAQSIGFVCAVRNEICPVHAIATSIRVNDSIGNESLFEAEVKRCAHIVREARELSARGRRVICFLDEPMHSTPPTEGAATTMSIASYVGALNGVRLFMTTHYHEVTRLEDMYPTLWKNVSMEAVYDTNLSSYTFPYRIRSGASFQCIALEILKERDLPNEVVETAIEMKNKICEVVVDQYAS